MNGLVNSNFLLSGKWVTRMQNVVFRHDVAL